jgi:hypothetical protein
LSAHNEALPNLPHAEIVRCMAHAGWLIRIMRVDGKPHPVIYAGRCDEVSEWRYVEHERAFADATPAKVKAWASTLSVQGAGRQWFDEFVVSAEAFA